MASKLKKALCFFGIVFGIIVGIFLIKYCTIVIPAFIAISSESRAKLEYYDRNLPNNEVELPYSIKDYEAVYLSNWNFETLTAKVKESKRDIDFWVFQDNYDILFGADEHLYIRKNTSFSSEISENTVGKISFFAEATENKDAVKISPNFTEEEVYQFMKILLHDDMLVENIQEDKYFSYEDDTRISWYIIFNLKNTDEMCYDGLYVRDVRRYWLVQDPEGNLYLKDFNGNCKLLPKDIAKQIEQSWQQ